MSFLNLSLKISQWGEEPDKVYLGNGWFNEILNRTYSSLNYLPWNCPVIKIQVKLMERRDQLLDLWLPGIHKG